MIPRAGVWCAKFGPGNSVVHRKPNLPKKLCAACNRPFAWRKKWERVWDEVRYFLTPAVMGVGQLVSKSVRVEWGRGI